MTQNIEIRKTFLPKQKKFLESAKPEVLYSGAWGAGKTRAICEKLLMLALRYPGNRLGLFRKTMKALKATTLVTLLQGDGETGPVIPPEYIYNHHKTEHTIALLNGSTIVYGGIERDTDNESWIKSLNLGAVAVDQFEELGLQDYFLLMGRLRLATPAVRQIFGACNPAHPGHWLYQRFFLNPGPGRQVITSNALENTFLPPDYLARLNDLTGKYYERYILGKWVAFEGLVYEHWDAEHNVSREADYNPEHSNIVEWGIDDGYANPRAVLFVQRTSRDIHIFGEHYQSRQLEEDAILDCLLKPKDKNDFPDVNWADHNEAIRWLREGREEKGLYPWPDLAIVDPAAAEMRGALYKWDIVDGHPAKCPIEESIKRVRSLICDRSGYRVVKIHPRCVQYIKDKGEYVRRPTGLVDANGEPVFSDRPTPNQPSSHTNDAERYWIWYWYKDRV